MVRMLGRYFLSFPRPIDVKTLALPIPVHPTRLGTHLGRRQKVDLPAHRRVQNLGTIAAWHSGRRASRTN